MRLIDSMTKQVSFLKFHTEGTDDSRVTKFAAVQKLVELLKDDWDANSLSQGGPGKVVAAQASQTISARDSLSPWESQAWRLKPGVLREGKRPELPLAWPRSPRGSKKSPRDNPLRGGRMD